MRRAALPRRLSAIIQPVPIARVVAHPRCGLRYRRGEASVRLAELFSGATVLGVDILDTHLARARARAAQLVPRVLFENQSIFDLRVPSGSFAAWLLPIISGVVPES